MIDSKILGDLHKRVLGGDVTASSELFRLVHKGLVATLRKKVGPGISWEDAADVATDAIVEYIKSPGKYDPARSGLFGYLLLIARGDALNAARDQQTQRKYHLRAVELSDGAGNTSGELGEMAIDADRILQKHHADLIQDEDDEAVLRLYLQGEKDTAAYADALGISRLSEAEARKVVKIRKDRIEQRLKRLKDVVK
jgi:RNA polymerase sigma factor (sigma-70 family)